MEPAQEQPKKSFWTDFRRFLKQHSAIGLAIGIVMGTAVNNVVNALVRGEQAKLYIVRCI